MESSIKFLTLMLSVIFLITGGIQNVDAGIPDIIAGPNPPVEPPFAEIFVNDGADFFVTFPNGDPNDDSYSVAFDENAESWLKHFTLCTPNGDTCDPHTVEAGEDITITERIRVTGDIPFTDWHEEIIETAKWEWVNTVTVQTFNGQTEDTDFYDMESDPDNIIIEDGTKLWIFFDEPLPAGSEIEIIKEIENISGFDIAGDTIKVLQYPSTEIIPTGPGIWGIKFNDHNGNGIQDLEDEGLGDVQICIDGEGIPDGEFGGDVAFLGFTLIQQAFAGTSFFDNCVWTDFDGSFHFAPLPLGEYLVYEVPDDVLVNTTPRQIPVVLTPEDPQANIEFGNQAPPPIPGEVTIVGLSNFKINGMDVVYWGSSIMIEKNVEGLHCQDGSSPLAGKVVMGPFAETPESPPVEVMLVNTVDKIWKATIPPVFPAHGAAPITFYFDCAPETPNFPEDISDIAFEDEIQLAGSVYVDPSGVIKDACTGIPISGATVFVQQSNNAGGPFVNSPALTPPLLPPINPQVTLANGLYGWVVQVGQYYKVDVTHPNYQGQTSISQFVGLPAVFNFDLLPNGIPNLASCPPSPAVGGELIPISTTALLLAGAQMTASWLIPIVIAGSGIGLFIVSRKSK